MSGKQAQEFGFPDCVFYTSKAFPGAVRAGYSFGVRGKRVIAVSIAQAELETREFLHKYFILLPVDSHYSFSFHGFYSDETRVLFKKGLILHQEGEVLAAKFWQISEETMCDGCPLPLYRNEYPHQSFPDMVEIFSLLNVFSFSGFPYPVILLDTSNVEGRAISFVTFNQEGKYSEYRLYEYIVDYAY
jgi:hypothetical protein